MILNFLKRLRQGKKKLPVPESRRLEQLNSFNYQLIFVDDQNSSFLSKEILRNLDRVKSVCEKNGYEFVCYTDHFRQQFNEIDLNALYYKYPFLKSYTLTHEEEINEQLYYATLTEKYELKGVQLPAILFVTSAVQEIFELSDSVPLGDQLNRILKEVYTITHTYYSIVQSKNAPTDPTLENKREAEVDASFIMELPFIRNEIYNEIDMLVSSGNKKLMEEVYQFLVKKKYNLKIETSSRLKIDSAFKLWLLDYGNLEIVLTPLQKTVYLFFLNHPDGVYLHDLIDFKDEFLQLYKLIGKNTDETDLEARIDDLVDMGSNSINEKCSRIKEAFIKVINPDLAKYYYITGERGQKKGIKLAEEFILNESPYQKQ